jgi:hypothetical protein
MRTPLRLPEEVLTEAVDEYMREVRRMRRLMLRQVVIDTCQATGVPVFEEDEMETHIDLLEALIEASGDDPDKMHQLVAALPSSPDGKLSSHQIVQSLEPYLVAAEPLVTDEELNQYSFAVTGKISTRCKRCRRGRLWTQQEFMQDYFLQRTLLGEKASCPFCHSGQIKVSGVTAVRRESAVQSNKPAPPKETGSVLQAASQQIGLDDTQTDGEGAEG